MSARRWDSRVIRAGREERLPLWRDSIRKLAALPNTHVKLGGLAMSFCNFPSFLQSPPASSRQLAAEWRPYVETCIEAFGVDRCMFESNFPVDMGQLYVSRVVERLQSDRQELFRR